MSTSYENGLETTVAGLRNAAGTHLGHVERGRVATMGGVVSLIWLVILVLMIWNS